MAVLAAARHFAGVLMPFGIFTLISFLVSHRVRKTTAQIASR
jgi:hypothetical protein